MTRTTRPSVHAVVPTARAYAVLTWVYVAAFGLPAVPVSVYLLQRGSLPWFAGLFPMYGGPWSDGLRNTEMVGLLLSYLGLTAVVAGAAGRVRQGSVRAAGVSAGLLPAEAVFWIGFALPIPWVLGAARLALLAASWRRLRGPQPTPPNPKENSRA